MVPAVSWPQSAIDLKHACSQGHFLLSFPLHHFQPPSGVMRSSHLARGNSPEKLVAVSQVEGSTLTGAGRHIYKPGNCVYYI